MYQMIDFHTCYSMMDSILRVEDVIKKTKENSQKYLGICDHNVLFNVYNFQNLCIENDIQPVIGCDFTVKGIYPDTFGNVKLYCKSNDGYKNLVVLSTLANTNKDIFPYISIDDLQKYSKGLLCLSGGDNSELIDAIQKNNPLDRIVETYYNIFKNDYYIEFTNHNISFEKELFNNKELEELIKKYSLDVVFTNNAHYMSKNESSIRALAHEFKANAIDGKDYIKGYEQRDKLTDFNDEFYYRTNEEMEKQFSEWLKKYPNGLENTEKIASICAGERIKIEQSLPDFAVPNGKTAEEYLWELTLKGFEERFSNGNFAVGKTKQDYLNQLEYEYNVITEMGFTNYFLIVQDFIQWCKDSEVYKHPEIYFPKSKYDWNKIPNYLLKKDYEIYVGPGRGSAAGSLLSYCLKITDVIDPLKYDLYFERFLNKERVSMPDIDTDYSNKDRYKVVEYAQFKYGFEHVCQIVTFQCLNPKSLFKRLAKTLNVPYAEADKITKDFPSVYFDKEGNEKKVKTLSDLRRFESIEDKIKHLSWVREIFEKGKVLDGLPANTGKHAAGVIIGSKPLQDKMALMEVDGILVSQFEKKNAEKIGNLKMDFLGLQTEDLIEDVISIIQKRKNEKIKINEIPLDDEETYKMLQRGESSNVFQLESSGMKRLLKNMKPTEFEHLSAVLALFRPGPMQFIDEYINGFKSPETVHYPHPIFKEVTENTFGVLVYQEQIMSLVQKMAGFTLGEADILRRGIGGKVEKYLVDGRKQFIDGAKKLHNIDEEISNEIYDTIVKFANYGFNKAHSIAYGVISYQTAWLKCHYPVEFMCGCLNLNADSIADANNKLAATIAETKRMGIEILPPKYGESMYDFTVVDDKTIRFGLRGVKAVGDDIANFLNGKHQTDFNSAISEIPYEMISKRALQNLIYSGYFDEFENRQTLDKNLSFIIEENKIKYLFQKANVPSWFSNLKPFDMSKSVELPMIDKLLKERDVIQYNFENHPIDVVRGSLSAEINENTIASLMEEPKDDIKIALLVEKIRKFQTKKGDEMATLQCSDASGDAEIVLFPNKWKEYKDLISSNIQKNIIVSGNAEIKYDGETPVLSIIAENIDMINVNNDVVFIDSTKITKETLKKLSSLNGSSKVILVDVIKNIIKDSGISIDMNKAKKILPKNTYYQNKRV